MMEIGHNLGSNEEVVKASVVKRAEQYAQAGNTVGKKR